MQKREEARISDALDQRGILNVSLAEQPVVPALPKRSPLSVALLTLLLAGTFSLSTAFVLDFMDPTFRTPDELAGYLGAAGARCIAEGRRVASCCCNTSDFSKIHSGPPPIRDVYIPAARIGRHWHRWSMVSLATVVLPP